MENKESMSTVEQDKLDLIQWVAGLNEEIVIERLKMLKENPSQTDWWDEISEAERSAIKDGLIDIEDGNVKPHGEAKYIYGKWL